MKLFNQYLLLFIIFFGNFQEASANLSASKIEFWDHQRKGVNIFNQKVTREDIRAAKKYHIEFIRLAPDRFVSEARDFLIGNADNYQSLARKDLQKLREILDICLEEKMAVVLTMLSLPGSRWKQNNHNKDDLRIWQDQVFKQQAADFWRDLAKELKDHPAIIGYNILNEPHPERIFPSIRGVKINEVNQKETQKILGDFYHLSIKNIREVDEYTPIIVDSSAYGDSKTFAYLQPQNWSNILYSFHMYEPYEYSNYKINRGKSHYPGKIAGKYWNKDALIEYVRPVVDFCQINKIANNRILVGEFGGNRRSPGLEKYFKDLLEIFDQEKWHVAFYAFREDVWDGMDYELGNKPLSWRYWQDLEKGKEPKLPRDDNNPIFTVIKNNYNKLSGDI